MNWKRGLLRAWMAVSLLWATFVGLYAYGELSKPYPFGRTFQHVEQTRQMPWDIDWSKPFYERSFAPGQGPHKETFVPVESRDLEGFDRAVREDVMVKVGFPNGSLLYLNAQLTREDQELLSRMFWGERWKRAAAVVGPWVGWAFGPPAALLLLSLLTAWVVRGFRARLPLDTQRPDIT